MEQCQLTAVRGQMAAVQSSEYESRQAGSATMSTDIHSMSACSVAMSIGRGSISTCSDRAQARGERLLDHLLLWREIVTASIKSTGSPSTLAGSKRQVLRKW